jgi:hypothetical protein
MCYFEKLRPELSSTVDSGFQRLYISGSLDNFLRPNYGLGSIAQQLVVACLFLDSLQQGNGITVAVKRFTLW